MTDHANAPVLDSNDSDDLSAPKEIKSDQTKDTMDINSSNTNAQEHKEVEAKKEEPTIDHQNADNAHGVSSPTKAEDSNKLAMTLPLKTGDNRNNVKVVCQRCPSIILERVEGTFVEVEHFLPYVRKKSEANDSTEGEILNEYWCVDNIYTFENVGFTNTIDNIKYLACADCEIGPIGWHDIPSGKSYVALQRVNHK